MRPEDVFPAAQPKRPCDCRAGNGGSHDRCDCIHNWTVTRGQFDFRFPNGPVSILTGLVLFYVGIVLILNGLWLLDWIDDREIVLINLVVATVCGCTAVRSVAIASDIADIRAATMTLLVAITYLWVAYNRLRACDGRGLGWFSLLVALSVTPVAMNDLAQAAGAMGLWLALSWAAWALLWLMYFILLVPGWITTRATGISTLATGVATGWLPGMLLLWGA